MPAARAPGGGAQTPAMKHSPIRPRACPQLRPSARPIRHQSRVWHPHATPGRGNPYIIAPCLAPYIAARPRAGNSSSITRRPETAAHPRGHEKTADTPDGGTAVLQYNRQAERRRSGASPRSPRLYYITLSSPAQYDIFCHSAPCQKAVSSIDARPDEKNLQKIRK